jgi:uncharacterized protein
MRVRRIDVGTLAAPVRRADGSIIVEARIARTGVQTYRNKDGSTRVEYRPDAEVSRSMQSLRLVPVTHKHPPTMLDASNAKAYAVGAVGENIRRDGEWIVAPLAIFDSKTIEAMDAGKNQVSAGYECELDETPGTAPTGERYDAVQRDIAINHVATALDNARAGREAAARMDALAADEEIEERSDAMDKDEQIRALKLRCDQSDAEIKTRQDALDAANGERDGAQAEVKTLKERVAALEAQIAAGHTALETEAIKTHSQRADSAEATVQQMKANREAEIRAAAELRIKACAVMGDKFSPIGMPDRAIREIVIKKLAPKEDLSKASDAYLTSRCDSLVEAFTANARAITRVSEVSAPVKQAQSKEARAAAWRNQALTPYQVSKE